MTLKIFNNTPIFQQTLDTIIREDIAIKDIEILPVELPYHGTRELYQTSNKEWRIALVLKHSEEVDMLEEGLKAIFSAFFIEQYRARLTMAYQEYNLSEYGSELIQKLTDFSFSPLDNWMKDALVYYLPMKNEILSDIRLLESMLKDVFNVAVKVTVEDRYLYQKGSTLRGLVLGTNQAIGGQIKPNQQNLICSFSPKTQEESISFFPGGKWFSFLHDALFRYFVNDVFYPIKKIVPLAFDSAQLEGCARLTTNKIVIV